jgi:hypothetical protein
LIAVGKRDHASDTHQAEELLCGSDNKASENTVSVAAEYRSQPSELKADCIRVSPNAELRLPVEQTEAKEFTRARIQPRSCGRCIGNNNELAVQTG